jgi:hypothetical protein
MAVETFMDPNLMTVEGHDLQARTTTTCGVWSKNIQDFLIRIAGFL